MPILSNSFIILLLVAFSFLCDFGLSLGGNRVYVPFLLIVGLLPIIVSKNLKINKNQFKLIIPLIGFVFCAILSIVNIVNSPLDEFKGERIGFASVKIFLYLFIDLIIVFYILQYNNLANFNKLFVIIKIMSILTILYGIVEYINIQLYDVSNTILDSPLAKIMSIFHAGKWGLQRNYLSLLGWEHSFGVISSLILYCFFIASIHCKYKIFKVTLVNYIACLLLLILSVLTDSKGGYISIVLIHFVLIFSIVKDRKNNKVLLIPIILGSIVFIAVWGLVISTRINQIALKQGSSSYTRHSFLATSIDMGFRYPVLGVGLSNFKFFYSESIEKLKIAKIMEVEEFTDTKNLKTMPDPGNMIVGVFCEMGLLGLLFFLFFLVSLLWKVTWLTKNTIDKQSRTISYGLLYSFFAILGSFSSKYLYNIYIWWIIFGLILSFYYCYRFKNSELLPKLKINML